MSKLGRLVKWLILVPVLAVVALLSVANDHQVTLNLNPLEPAMQIDLALYQIGFAAFVAGALVGAFIVWNNQRKYRRKARDSRYEAARWQAKSEQAERPATTTGTLLAGRSLSRQEIAGRGGAF